MGNYKPPGTGKGSGVRPRLVSRAEYDKNCALAGIPDKTFSNTMTDEERKQAESWYGEIKKGIKRGPYEQ